MLGTRRTEKVKLMRHVSRSVSKSAAARTSGDPSDGVKRTRPVAGSITTMSKALPAQLVPDAPVPVALSWKTPGSAPPAQVGVKLPHEATSVSSVTVTEPVASAPLAPLINQRLAG